MLLTQPENYFIIFFYPNQKIHEITNHLLTATPDDTDSLCTCTTIYDVLLLSYGFDEDDLYDHIGKHTILLNIGWKKRGISCPKAGE